MAIYRYVYLPCRHKYTIQDVPFTDYTMIFNSGIGIPESQEDIKYNQDAILPYRKYWRDRLVQHKLDRAMQGLMKVVTKQFIKDEKVSHDLSLLLRLRVSMLESVLEAKDSMMATEGNISMDLHQLANSVFRLLLEESEDLTMYKVLVAANIRDAAGLLDIDDATTKKIMDALPNKSRSYNLVLSYLNLISYNNLCERNLEVNEDDNADRIEESDRVAGGDDTTPDLEGNINGPELSSKDQIGVDSSADVANAAEIGSKIVVNNPRVRKVINNSKASSGVIENNPSIRKVVNRNSSSSFSVPNSETGYSTSDKIQADTDWRAENMQDVNSTDDVSWSAPTKNVAKKTWFR